MMITKMVLCASMLTLGAAQASEPKTQPQAEQKAKQTTAKTAEKAKPKSAEKAKPKSAAELELADKKVDGVKLRAIEVHVVSYTNEERARYGLPPLQVDKELMETAREHAAWMTRNHAMVHTSRPVAENIAMGQPHSSDVVRAWMNSSGHRANILNAGHRRIGVAAFRTEGGTIFWCQQFCP
jgi:uncharacterized protein YkwD